MTKENWRNVMDLLIFILPVKHNYYKNLTINRNDESSRMADGEATIYNNAELSKRIMLLK